MSIDTTTVLVVVALLAGIVVRASYLTRGDFPLNDGGLFYQMTLDIQRAGYALPSFTSYNELRIPFAYPPLAFYVAAIINDLTPLSLADVFRYLPLVVTCCTIPAFYLPARSLLESRLAAAVSVMAFALLPRSYIWLLMGGGVARSLGLLFALLALWQAVRLFQTGRVRFAVGAGLLSGLTVLSHLETGYFLAFSIIVLFFGLGAYRQHVRATALLGMVAAVIVLPWFGLMLANHGVEPLLAAQGTGGNFFSSPEHRTESIIGLLRFISTSEPLFPVIGVVAFLGLLVSVVGRRWLLPAWWLAIIVLDVRAFPTFTMVPIAMLAGVGFVEVVLPALTRAATSGQARATATNSTLPLVVTAVLGAIFVVGRLFVTSPVVVGEAGTLTSLSQDERAAMAWVSNSTPPDSAFLVVPDSSWETARTSEWFPVLARRTSVATVQGTEWLSGGAFVNRVHAYYTALDCGYQNVDCLDIWLLAGGPSFSHVYVAKSPVQCCGTLVTSLRTSAQYAEVYDGDGATIFARKSIVDGGPGDSPPLSQVPDPR